MPARDVTYVSHVERVGGAERSLLDLVAAFGPDDVRPRAIVPVPGELFDAFARRGVPVATCTALGPLARPRSAGAGLGAAWRLWHGARALARVVRADPPQLLHANSTTAALFSLRAARNLRVPLVWHLRDLVALGPWAATLGRRCAAIVAPSSSVARWIGRFVPRERIVEIANGVDLERFARARGTPAAAALRAELAPDGGPLVVGVGQLVPWKGFTLFVDAAEQVLRERPEARFAIAGDERFADLGAAEVLEARIRHAGLTERVRLLGHVEDVPALFAAADLVVHAAYPEPFGRVVIEAMAAGRAVVALEGDHGPAEILAEGVGGRLVERGSPDALARAVLELLADDAARERLGCEGRERAEQRYRREHMAAAVAALYERVLGTTL